MKATAELSIRAVFLGILLSIVMGAANVYLGLRAGITVTASVPAAVVSMVLLRKLLRNGTILESNQVQTAASAGESLAAGIIFTMPALVLIGVWGSFNYWMTTLIAMAGGILGVLFMIPMREVFIKNTAKGKALPYPEGAVCAKVLQAGESGEDAGQGARFIFEGGVLGALIKVGESAFGLLRGSLEGAVYFSGRVGYFGMEALPALIAVGYIVRLVVSSNIFIGGCIAWLCALPLLSGGRDIGALDPVDFAYTIWSNEIRYVGVGAMLVGGVLTIVQVREGLAVALSSLKNRARFGADDLERSLRMKTIVVWSAFAVLLTAIAYTVLIQNILLALLTTLIMVVASFFFTAVASYIVGLVGNSNCPVSGMTITSVLFAGLLFWIFGFEGKEGMLATLGVAAVVCCVACTSGDVCNDLKTGQLVGASPQKQQIMQIIGVVTASFFIAPILQLLHTGIEGGIGGPSLPAPQAQLFASLAEGFFGQGELPWSLVGAGVLVGLLIVAVDRYLLSLRGTMRLYIMPTAVGMYLPLGLSVPIFIGGLLAWWGERKPSAESAGRIGHHNGMLYASGLIAGESLLGVGVALIAVCGIDLTLDSVGGSLSAGLTICAMSLVCWRILRASGPGKKSS